MTLLAAKNYDPGTAVAKSTAALLAITALDTTNLRNTFTVPSNGAVAVRLAGVVHGATTFPQILVAVLQGATIVARRAPMLTLSGTAAATTFAPFETMLLVTGLTGGASLTWDAAYGVETAVSGTAIRYGGPNNATANDAFGAFEFSVWAVS